MNTVHPKEFLLFGVEDPNSHRLGWPLHSQIQVFLSFVTTILLKSMPHALVFHACVFSGAGGHQGEGSGAGDGRRNGETEGGGGEVRHGGDAAPDQQPSAWWDSPPYGCYPRCGLFIVSHCCTAKCWLCIWEASTAHSLSQVCSITASRQVR